MLNNLEGIRFDEVIDSKGTLYSSFRAALKPRYKKVLFDISKGYFFLAFFSISILISFNQFPTLGWVLILPVSLLIGYSAAYLALFIHEAGHYNVLPGKKANDRFATFFLCLPFGLSMKSYRKIHWQHHLHLGTPDDTEISYFNELSGKFLAETLTGIHLLHSFFSKEKKDLLSKSLIRENRFMLLAGVLLHALILSVFIYWGHWPFAIAWVLGFGVFFPFFATLRQILEHRDEFAKAGTDFKKTSHGKVSRIFVHTLLSSSFGSAGFTRHMIHHWDPQISYTRLKEIELFLLNCTQTESIITNSKTRYRTVLKKLLLAAR